MTAPERTLPPGQEQTQLIDVARYVPDGPRPSPIRYTPAGTRWREWHTAYRNYQPGAHRAVPDPALAREVAAVIGAAILAVMMLVLVVLVVVMWLS